MQIGNKIKELREAKKITLTELSQKSGVQIATLSRIENLKMTGTLDSHMQIAKALNTDVTQLYQNLESAAAKSEPSTDTSPAPESFSYNASASYEILATKILSRKMMPIVLRIEKEGKTNPEQNPPGTEKFIFVLEGSVTVHVEDNHFSIKRNNTLYFDASKRHYFENPGKSVTKIISVTTPVAL